VGPAAGSARTGHGLFSSRCVVACALSSTQRSIDSPTPAFSAPVPLLLCGAAIPLLPQKSAMLLRCNPQILRLLSLKLRNPSSLCSALSRQPPPFQCLPPLRESRPSLPPTGCLQGMAPLLLLSSPSARSFRRSIIARARPLLPGPIKRRSSPLPLPVLAIGRNSFSPPSKENLSAMIERRKHRSMALETAATPCAVLVVAASVTNGDHVSFLP
jgi:hypothetical protein